MPKGSQKGSAFERQICTQLSRWWTNGERDDVFWRSSGSGARATTRSKSGRKTFGQYGDIQAIDPIGQPLIDLITIECKRGYKSHVADMLDLNTKNRKPCMWQEFVEQAIRSSGEAGTPHWMLITRRDHRETLVFFPSSLWKKIEVNDLVPLVRLRIVINDLTFSIYGTKFVNLLARWDAGTIRND